VIYPGTGQIDGCAGDPVSYSLLPWSRRRNRSTKIVRRLGEGLAATAEISSRRRGDDGAKLVKI
jgi:hypothetical protein